MRTTASLEQKLKHSALPFIGFSVNLQNTLPGQSNLKNDIYLLCYSKKIYIIYA